jgi:AraC-like DNA-binding protein
MGGYVELAPPPALRTFLDCLWVHVIDDPPPPEGRRLLPSGQVDLVWLAGMGVRVSGPQTRYTQPPDLPRMVVFGARFHAGTASMLLRAPASSIVDAHIDLDAFDPRLAARLDDRLLHARDASAAMASFAEELRRGLRPVSEPDVAVIEAIRLLDRGEPVAGVAERTFVSERALQRRFAEHVGYGPKTLQRVLRLQRFLRAMPRAPLARAAALAGYADQSHLTREARRLTGLTPSRLVSWQH